MTAMTYKPWTQAEIIQLKRLVDERVKVKEIAHILERTCSAITTKKAKLGIRKALLLSSHNPLHLAEVIKFKMAGWNLEAIAKVYGCKLTHVSGILVKNGMKGFMRQTGRLEKPYDYWSEYEQHRLRRYCKKGYAFDRICTYFPNRSHKAVKIRIQQMTRYWFTSEEQKARRISRENEMKWRVY